MGIQFKEVPEDAAKLLEEFCLEFMPWYCENNDSPKGEQQTVDGTDTCMPALWCDERTLIAYSKEGYDNRSWELPSDWEDVTQASISKITLRGPEPAGGVPVADGRIVLSVGKGEALSVCAA
jgi:hypothetical protein